MRIALQGLAVIICMGLLADSIVAQPPNRDARGKGLRRGARPDGKYNVGDLAPDFTLSSLDGKRKVRLSRFRGKRPVALIFGSYT